VDAPPGLEYHLQVFSRIARVAPETWELVEHIWNAWYGGCIGFGCSFYDRARTEQVLHDSPRLARDRSFGAAEHQESNRAYISRVFSDRDCHCWREVPAHAGDEGLHYNIATDPARSEQHDNIHIDWQDPVEGREPDGTCNYDFGVGISHWLQAMQNVGVPDSPFATVDALLYQFQQEIQLARSTPPAPRPAAILPRGNSWYSYAGPGEPPGEPGPDGRTHHTWDELETLFGEVKSRWHIHRRRYAAREYNGWTEAETFLRTARRDLAPIHVILVWYRQGITIVDDTP